MQFVKSRCRKALGLLSAFVGLFMFSGVIFATTPPGNFSQLATNISSLEFEVLKIVQIVITLAGILLVIRGIIHLKQHAHGSPQEKHLPKGIANIVFAALLFIAVPLVHMLVGSLSQNIGSGNENYNTDWAAGANTAGTITTE